MSTSDINPKIKTLITDLKSLSIGKYLKTTAFERKCIQRGLENLWHQAYEMAKKDRTWYGMNTDHQKYDTEKAMSLVIDLFYQEKKTKFYEFVSFMLEGFIDWSEEAFDLSSVFEDLTLIDFPNEKLAFLKGIFEKKQIEWVHKKREQEVTEIPEISKIKIKDYPPEVLKTHKKGWIKLIATSQLEKVIEDIFEFSEGVEASHILKDVIIQSSRLNELRTQFNQGTLTDESYRIERSKIMSALIDLIDKIR